MEKSLFCFSVSPLAPSLVYQITGLFPQPPKCPGVSQWVDQAGAEY